MCNKICIFSSWNISTHTKLADIIRKVYVCWVQLTLKWNEMWNWHHGIITISPNWSLSLSYFSFNPALFNASSVTCKSAELFMTENTLSTVQDMWSKSITHHPWVGAPTYRNMPPSLAWSESFPMQRSQPPASILPSSSSISLGKTPTWGSQEKIVDMCLPHPAPQIHQACEVWTGSEKHIRSRHRQFRMFTAAVLKGK